MSDLIRWHPDDDGGFIGCVGTLAPAAFKIAPPDLEQGEDEWLLSVRLTGRFCYGETADEVKRLAEERLRQFASSLGAVFPARRPASEWLCSLSDGDLITIEWSGQPRTVAVVVTGEDVALRDLTEDEMARLVEEEATRAAEEAGR